MSDTPGMAFYHRQLEYLNAKDVDGLIDNHYNDDAVLISFDKTVVGSVALKEHFRGYLEMLGTLKVDSTDNFSETENTVFLEATVTTNLGQVQVYDAFVMRDGKVAYHFTGIK